MSDAYSKGANMRSELIGSVEKYKLSSEMPSGRRKLQPTKAHPFVNGESSNAVDDGDFSDNNKLKPSSNSKLLNEVNMVAAMQDHISCTKLKSSGDGEKDLTKMTFELDHMYANSSGVRLSSLAVSLSPSTASSIDEQHPVSDDDAQQIQCLKELLILNLDLISQEQEKCNLKDLQIAELKKENELLKQQLREVEKCRRKSKKVKSTELSRGEGATDSESGGESSHWRSPSRRHFDRRRKRDTSQLEAHLREHKKRRRKSLEEKTNWGLSTDVLYYSPVGEVTRTAECHEELRPIDVQVPGWRVKVVTSCYQMEGTENLDDDLFLKRHQKLEIDEKRRKRWDIQRIREQKMQEKLRLGRQNKKTKPTKKTCIKTFYPNVDDVQMLEVSEVLPVSAFGRPICKTESR